MTELKPQTHHVLVTGGAGFLGSHLCDRLIESGARVICVDNFFTGVRSNIEHLLDRPEFTLIEHDVIEPLDPQRVGPLDRIYNLACPASPPHYQYDPIFTLKTSVLGALNMLELAHMTGARILQASTSEVYGDPEEHPQRESYRGCVNPIGPRACYDEGKRAAETLYFDYQRTRHVDIRVARIFNTYGPRMHPFDGRVVSNFIRQALSTEDLTMYGDGEQTRSFCFVDDLVEGLVQLMERDDAGPGPINLGNPGEFTMRELADLVLELTKSESSIVHQPIPTDDPQQRRPDISLAGQRLDWRPGVQLREGLEQTIAWFRSIDVRDYSPPTPASDV